MGNKEAVNSYKTVIVITKIARVIILRTREIKYREDVTGYYYQHKFTKLG